MARKTDNQVRKQFARWTDQDLANRWNVSKLDQRNLTQAGELKVSYIKLTDEILREAEFRGITNMLCCDTSSFKTLAEALAFKPYD